MRIVGNLDVEVTWARMDAAARRARGEKAPSPDDPRFALPEPVMRKISAAATLMRVFAQRDDDVLWTPRPVDPARMARVDWLPTPRLESGPVPETADVWWGEPTEVAGRVNHRLFAWQAKVRCRQPRLRGGTIVYDIPSLQRAASEMLGADGGEPWVAKAPFSAAGRLRVRGVGELEDKQRFQAQRLLELQGVLLFEPWMDRIADLGVRGEVRASRASILGIHGIAVDRAGRFTGISWPPGGDAQDGLELGEAARMMGDALRDAGYVGSFGVDAFLYRAGDARHLQPISEINARLTFGAVAAAVTSADPFEEPSEPVTLRFGSGAPPDGTIPLLLPGTDDDTSAWLETPSRHAG